LIQRLLQCGLTLAKDKCVFNQPLVDYYGHTFSAEGVAIQQKHVEALLDMTPPTNPAEIKLSTATYSARFIPNLATLSPPLRKLTAKGKPWRWGTQEQNAFKAIKQGLRSSTFIAYFDPRLRSSLIVDASPVGLAATLVQTKDGVRRVIRYASRSLTPVECQTEREAALSCIWACEHFRRYLMGPEKFSAVSNESKNTSLLV